MLRFLWAKVEDVGRSPCVRDATGLADCTRLQPIPRCWRAATAAVSRARRVATKQLLLGLGAVMPLISQVGISMAATAQVMPTVPSVVGLTCDEARVKLRQLHFLLQSCPTGKATESVPVGTINYQSVSPGAPLAALQQGFTVAIEPPPAAKPPPPITRRQLPNLLGKTCQEAANALSALDFSNFECKVGAAVPGYSAGRIYQQSRDPGTSLPIKGVLVLTLQPSDSREVPALAGMSEQQALDVLTGRGLKAAPYGPAASSGRRVLDQNPSAGARVPAGTSVGVRLGLTVPDLSGQSCAGARSLAERYGHPEVHCDTRPSDSSDRPIDQVFEQSPPASARAFPDPVAIRVVAWVAQPVTVPDVRDKKVKAAVVLLEQAKLTARPDSTTGDREVTAQDPPPGASVDRGSVVRLTTSLMGEVPDVLNRNLAEARRAIGKAGLRSDPDAADHSDSRIVSDQAPKGGSRVRLGSSVRLTTTRLAPVTNLVGMTCPQAITLASQDEFVVACDAEHSWREQLFGTPQIRSQDPPAGSVQPVGSTIHASAAVPVPTWLRWLDSIPLTVLVAGLSAPLLAAVVWLAIKPVPGGPAVSPHWRVEPDAHPTVNLRLANPGDGKSAVAAGMSWRVVPDEPRVVLRETAYSGGEDARV